MPEPSPIFLQQRPRVHRRGGRPARVLRHQGSAARAERRGVPRGEAPLRVGARRGGGVARLARGLGKMSEAEAKAKARELASATRGTWQGTSTRGSTSSPRAPSARSSARSCLRCTTLRHFGSAFDLRALDGRVLVEGPAEHDPQLAEMGTLVFVPTHLSNMDSIVFGFALERAGLPPATYGAGKNLFTQPASSRSSCTTSAPTASTGASSTSSTRTCSRRTRACSSSAATTRSSSRAGRARAPGGVERRLKLGLAGTGVEAYARTAERGEAGASSSSPRRSTTSSRSRPRR